MFRRFHQQRLADGAKMGRSLGNDNTLHRGRAAGTGLSGPPKDLQGGCVSPVAAGTGKVGFPIPQGCSPVPDAPVENLPDTAEKILRRRPVQGIRRNQGMQPGGKEAFVGVDISQTGDKSLVQQQSLQRPFAGCMAGEEQLRSQGRIEGFRSQGVKDPLRFLRQNHATELAGVVEHETPCIKKKDNPVVGVRSSLLFRNSQHPGHAKMDDQA